MVDEINDVRIIGVITAVVMMAVALAGLTWESKVSRLCLSSCLSQTADCITFTGFVSNICTV